MKKRRKHRLYPLNGFDVFVYAFCILFGVICFYPLWYVFIGSISPYDTFASAGIALWPTGAPSFRYYIDIFNTGAFRSAFLISVIKTVLGTGGMIVITSCLAYGVSKAKVKGMQFINVAIIVTMFFGGTIVQYYMLYVQMKLIDTLWVMVIPGFVDTWTFIIMRNYFANNVPAELEQAAEIDGANEAVVFARIVVPISKAIFAAMILFSAVGHWNDWVSYTYYCKTTTLQPFVKLLQRLLQQPNLIHNEVGANVMQNTLPPPMAMKYTTIMCAMLPIMLVYPFLQKHFAKGILIGAVKE